MNAMTAPIKPKFALRLVSSVPKAGPPPIPPEAVPALDAMAELLLNSVVTPRGHRRLRLRNRTSAGELAVIQGAKR